MISNILFSDRDDRMDSDLGDDKLMVIAIDFGTTYSGYAFSLKQDPLKISENTGWIGGGLMSHKTPTSLLLKPDRTLDKFGYEAEDKYFDLASEDQHREWYFFSRFKMLLYNKKVCCLTLDVSVCWLAMREHLYCIQNSQCLIWTYTNISARFR